MISAAEAQAGQAAYDQVAAFAALRRRRMGLIYALFPVLFAVMAAAAFVYGVMTVAIICGATAVADAIFTAWKWQQLRSTDECNRALLVRLQTQHGDDLPWLEAERQMAEIRQIQAEESRLGPSPDEPR